MAASLVEVGQALAASAVQPWVPEPVSVAVPVLPMPAPGDSSLLTHEVHFVVGFATLALSEEMLSFAGSPAGRHPRGGYRRRGRRRST